MRNGTSTYWRKLRQVRLTSLLGMLAATGSAVVLAAMWLAGGFAPVPVHAATVWQATVGIERHDQGIQGNGFLPSELWIDAGDSVTWTSKAGEIHTVSFLSGGDRPPLVVFGPTGPAFNPLVAAPQGGATYNGTGYANSGLLTEGGTYTLTFTQPGTYSFVCLVHSTMSGTLHVKPAGAPYPYSQASYDTQAQKQGARLLAEGQRVAASGLQAAARAGRGQVTAGAGELLPETGVAVLRFQPEQIVIKVGDTVTWTNRDPETPHTVTFGAEPPGGPLGVFAPSGTDSPGHATISSPGQAVNSGVIGAGLPSVQFRATFTVPGTYAYYCALHDDLGMLGTVIVTPTD